jgi:hypothetical protein
LEEDGLGGERKISPLFVAWSNRLMKAARRFVLRRGKETTF